jgi:large subunit ribosomal protein L21
MSRSDVVLNSFEDTAIRRDWLEEVYSMYAIIKTGGKQYRVYEGDILNIEKLDVNEGTTVEFNEVLAISDDDNNLKVGAPILEGAKVEAKVLNHGKGKKVIVFKYKPKKNYRRKQGHRQPYTRVQITNIIGEN